MSDGKRDKGVVLVTTLLIMGLMSALAVQVLDDILLNVRRTANIQAQTQVSWLMRGADQYSRTYLGRLVEATDPRIINNLVLDPTPQIIPLEEAVLTIQIKDGTNCFPLMSLVSGQGEADRDQIDRLIWVLNSYGVNPGLSQPLAEQAADWQDSDILPLSAGAEDSAYANLEQPYRPPNRPMSTVMELRALQVVTPEIYTGIQPLMCTGNMITQPAVNINTLDERNWALLRIAFGSDLSDSELQGLVLNRPAGGYGSADQFWAQSQFVDRSLPNTRREALLFAPQSFWVETEIEFNGARRFMTAEYIVQGTGGLRRSFLRQTREPFRIWPEDNRP